MSTHDSDDGDMIVYDKFDFTHCSVIMDYGMLVLHCLFDFEDSWAKVVDFSAIL